MNLQPINAVLPTFCWEGAAEEDVPVVAAHEAEGPGQNAGLKLRQEGHAPVTLADLAQSRETSPSPSILAPT